MAAGEDWSPQEVRATVLDYMAMLKFELSAQTYNKTTHRRALLTRLAGRSDGAVELKHQNISAVLRDMGHFWIPGYKPRSNYQGILATEIEAWVAANPEIDRHALAAAEAPAATPEHFDFTTFEVSSPSLRVGSEAGVREMQAPFGEQTRVAVRRDYAAREARNSSLGQAGEELVVKFEQYRLLKDGRDHLAAKVEHVSKDQGDGLGFDVLSFDSEGNERFIEVKTTAFAKETPFYASASEIRFAQKNAERFSLYRLFEFRKTPKCYTLPGMIEDHCALDPINYRCSFR
ncbi:MAG: DUF3883 domain-containing protein [Verrucomicrobiales bacterium]|nr:MAG: DUF3883 domain-containing protein [Verrucomicrobiales bacterium]